MESSQLRLPESLPETDAAVLRGITVSDDLNSKVVRSQLDLQHIQQEAAVLLNQLYELERRVRAHVKDVEEALSHAVTSTLDDPATNLDTLTDTLVVAGGLAPARQLLTSCQRAVTAIDTHLQTRQRDYAQGTNILHLRGKIRSLRAENARYALAAEDAERELSQGESRLPEQLADRYRKAINDFRIHSRGLSAWEEQLVNPQSYQPQSEAAYMHQLVMAALTSGRS